VSEHTIDAIARPSIATSEHPDTISSHRSVWAAIINHHGSAKHVLTAVAPLPLTAPLSRVQRSVPVHRSHSFPFFARSFPFSISAFVWLPGLSRSLAASPLLPVERLSIPSFLLLRFSPLTSPFACFVLESYVFPVAFLHTRRFRRSPFAVRRSPFAPRFERYLYFHY